MVPAMAGLFAAKTGSTNTQVAVLVEPPGEALDL